MSRYSRVGFAVALFLVTSLLIAAFIIIVSNASYSPAGKSETTGTAAVSK
jgi:hypothetical protein